LCSPSCLHQCSLSLDILKHQDSPSSPYFWMNNSFSPQEFESAIDSSKRKSSPGLDRIDYSIIRSLPLVFPQVSREFLLKIYNDIFSQGLFPTLWKDSLLILLPKADGKSVRLIALLSCLLKIFERLVYHRLQWAVESRFIFPEFQSGFKNSRSCVGNLVTLSARVHSAFLQRASTYAIFLDMRTLSLSQTS